MATSLFTKMVAEDPEVCAAYEDLQRFWREECGYIGEEGQHLPGFDEWYEDHKGEIRTLGEKYDAAVLRAVNRRAAGWRISA
jgi:hypothetical protein